MSEFEHTNPTVEQFLDAYDQELQNRAHSIEALSVLEDGPDGGRLGRVRRIGVIALSEASLDMFGSESGEGMDVQATFNLGIRTYARIIAAERAGYRILAADSEGSFHRVFLDPSQEAIEDARARGEFAAPESALMAYLRQFQAEVRSRAASYRDLAEMYTHTTEGAGNSVGTHSVVFDPATQAALEMEREASDLPDADIANRALQLLAYFDAMQGAGVDIMLVDNAGNRSVLPPLRNAPGTTQEATDDPEQQVLMLATAFIESFRRSELAQQVYISDAELTRLGKRGFALAGPRYLHKVFLPQGSDELTGYYYETPVKITRALLEEVYVAAVANGNPEAANQAYDLTGMLMAGTRRPMRTKWDLLMALHRNRVKEVEAGNTLGGEAQEEAYARAVRCTVEIGERAEEIGSDVWHIDRHLDRDRPPLPVDSELFALERERLAERHAAAA